MNLKIHIGILVYSVIALLFCSCEKAMFCDAVEDPEIEKMDLNYKETDQITFKIAKPKNGFTYVWYSPKGESSMGLMKQLNQVRVNQSGTYKVVVYNEKRCDSASATVSISVGLKPIPCTAAPNTASFSSLIQAQNYTTTGELNLFGNYVVKAKGNNHSLTIEFPTNKKPEDGYYSTEDIYVSIDNTNNYTASQGGIYVRNNASGKLEITFCDLPFANVSSPMLQIFTGTAYLIEN